MSVKGSSKIILQIFCLYIVCCVFGPVCDAQGSSKGVLPTQGAIQSSFVTLEVLSTQVVTASANQSSSVTPVSSSSMTVSPTRTTQSPIKTPTPKTPSKPTTTTKTPVTEESGRKFDGLSFFGGMILGSAICIILLFAIKYYRAKKRSYHSL